MGPEERGGLVKGTGKLRPNAPRHATILRNRLRDQIKQTHFVRFCTLTPKVTLHTSPNYLVRLFTKTAGLPPMAYLRRRRLEMATQLLIDSDLLVGEVGNRVGWADANYFARRFRAAFGVTPTVYRARHRQGP